MAQGGAPAAPQPLVTPRRGLGRGAGRATAGRPVNFWVTLLGHGGDFPGARCPNDGCCLPSPAAAGLPLAAERSLPRGGEVFGGGVPGPELGAAPRSPGGKAAARYLRLPPPLAAAPLSRSGDAWHRHRHRRRMPGGAAASHCLGPRKEQPCPTSWTGLCPCT